VLALSMHDDERYVFDALKAGASGYVLKREVDQALLNAIRAVHRGDAFLTNAVERSLIRDWMIRRATGPTSPCRPREQEVLKLIAEAHTNKRDRRILHLAEKTVESHRAQPPAQARDARPRGARALRDPARVDGGVGERRPTNLRPVPQRFGLRPVDAHHMRRRCDHWRVPRVARCDRERADLSRESGWAGFVLPPGARAPNSGSADQTESSRRRPSTGRPSP
jgi:DNA-binding CsgD family transcriptional regulator